MKIKPVVERELKSYLPKLYVNSVEVENKLVTVHYYFRDLLDENYDFNWFDDKNLLKNINVNMALDVDGVSYTFAHSLYDLMYDYKDIKVNPADVDAFEERAYYFELTKKFAIDTEIQSNCLLSIKVSLTKDGKEEELVSSGIENIQVLKDGKITDQFYYETSDGKVYLGNVKQVGTFYLDINNNPLKRVLSNINYTIKDLRGLSVAFPKFERILKNTSIKNKKDIIYTRQTRKRLKRIADLSKINFSIPKPPKGIANISNARFTNVDLTNRTRNINSPEIRNRDLLDQEKVSKPVSKFPETPPKFSSISETIEDVFQPEFVTNDSFVTLPDIFLSKTADKRVHGLFSVDVEKILSKNSEFFQYISSDPYYKNRCLDQTFIKNITVSRFKIPNSEQERARQAKQVVAISSDSDSKNGIKFVDNEAISEVVGLNSDFSKRYFSFSDNTIDVGETGVHYYQVEVEVSDYTKNLLVVEFKDILDNALKQLQKYTVSVTKYAKNVNKPLFPKEYFYEKEYEQYSDLGLTIQNLAYIYAFLAKSDLSIYVKTLSSMLHPLSTNVALINKLISSIKKLSELTDKTIKYVDDITSEINSLGTSTNKTDIKTIYKEIKKFDRPENYVNLAYSFGTGVEYFDIFPFTTRFEKLNSRVGLLKLTQFEFNNRISREINKYLNKSSDNLSGKNTYLTTTFLDLKQESYDFINQTTTQGNEFVRGFDGLYSYFGNTENVKGIGSLFNVLASKGIYVTSIASKNNLSQNKFFPSVVSDNNPDSKTSSEKYFVDTRIDSLFISINKNNEVINQFKNQNFLVDSYISSAAKQKVVDSAQQALSRFVAVEKSGLEDYCRIFMTYGTIVKIDELISSTKYKLYKLNKDIGLVGLHSEITKNTSTNSDIVESKNIPLCDEFFLVDIGGAAPTRSTEKVVDLELFKQFNSNNVKSEYMRNFESNVNDIEDKVKSLVESI